MKYFLLVLILLAFSQAFAQTRVTYTASDEIFANPERGFYTHTSGYNEYSGINANTLKNVRAKNQSLILSIYYITKFAKSDLNTAFLDMLENDFKLMRQNGIKCILRFAYSNNIGVADATLEYVLRHLDQLEPYLKEYRDVIAFMQAGFIGAWGEWHSSENGLDNTAGRKAVLEKILLVLPKDRMVQVRTPYYKSAIYNNYSPVTEVNAFDESNYSRTGHHNDCFLADDTDMGTYSDTSAQTLYISRDALYVPVGGETCSPSEFSGCPNTLYQMERLHWTYVNNDYHGSVISGWKNNGCYPDIQKRLGYRFELLEGTYTDSTKPGGTLGINIKIRNTGFASLYNPRKVELLLRSAADTFFVKLDEDPRFWQSGDTVNLEVSTGIPASMANGNYELLLNMPDISEALHDSPTFSIRFANQDVWDAATGYNSLKININVDPSNSSEDYSGDYFFQKKGGTVAVNDPPAEMDYKIYIRNYPNPFNGTTILDYSVPEAGNVTIKIYNTLGEEVATVLNEYKGKGLYKASFNSDAFASQPGSGIYFYVLNTGSKISSGKMVLLK
jgi:hypothetical protein